MLNIHGDITDLRIQGYHSLSREYNSSSHLKSCEVAVVSNSISVQWTDTSLVGTVKNKGTLYNAAYLSLLGINHSKQRIFPTSIVLYNTIDSDLALATLPTAMVTITVVDMIMSLVTFTKIRN